VFVLFIDNKDFKERKYLSEKKCLTQVVSFFYLRFNNEVFESERENEKFN
jgi:hypothetical protein